MGYRYQQGDRPLPGYTIQRGVGRGGFGEVYYATSDGGKEVAIKHLRDNPQVELRGVQHVLNLKSPYLVGVHDVRQNAEGDFFIIMEYVSGPSLRDLMNDAPNGLGPQKAAYFAREIAKGLAYLHEHGIVHRDIKPGNIFYEDGYVKIGDYGLSKFMAASQHSGQTVSVGTVHYMAPEVGSGNYDRTIDVYALGVMLYEMLLGRVPFGGSSMGEVLMKHLTAQPEVDELQPPFPHVIRKALAKDPKDRYPDVDQLIHDLFEEEDLSRSVAAFEPRSLSARAARAAADVRDRPIHAFGTGSSNIGQHASPPHLNAPPLPPPRIHMADEHARPAPLDEASRVPALTALIPKVIQCAIVTLGMSIAFAAVNGNLNLIAPIFLTTMITALAVFGAEWLARFHTDSRGNWWPKLIVAVVIAVPIGGALRRTFGEMQLIEPLGLGLMVVVISWRSLLREGQTGSRSMRLVFMAGLMGFGLGFPFAGGDMQWGLAIIAATAALCVQTLGQLWPVEISEADIKGEPPSVSSMEYSDPRGFDANETMPAAGGRFANPGAGRAGGSIPETHRRNAPVAEIVREPRNPWTRFAWGAGAAVSLLSALFFFIAPNVSNDFRGDDWGIATIVAVVSCSVFVFCLSCAAPRYKAGIWRGVLRKAVFFGGVAIASGVGTATGVIHFKDSELAVAILVIIVGALMAVSVWFIPVAPYRGADYTSTPDEKPKNALAMWLKLIGGLTLALCMLLTTILLITLPEHDWDDIVAPICIPIGVLGVMLLGGGFIVDATAKRSTNGKLKLPLRREMLLNDTIDLGSTIERFGAMHSYRLIDRGDMFWSLQRGAWASQFFNSDVRKWKTRLNCAAFAESGGAYRLNCILDVDAEINAPGKKHLQRLSDELDELERLVLSASSHVEIERDQKVRA